MAPRTPARFCSPGIPQVYYVGLLAGANDMDLLAKTGVGRDINRHYYKREEIDAAIEYTQDGNPACIDLAGLLA